MSERETVTVAGAGAVAAAPDVLRLNLGVECRGSTVDAALSEANTAMSAVQRALLSAGVPQVDLRTSELSIRTEYDHQGRRVAGFVVSQGLHVVVRDLSAAGGLLGAAAGAGGDSTRVNGLRLDVEDDAALLADARTRAISDARLRAETYAAAAGRSVGRVVRISEGSAVEPVPVRARMMAGESGGVPIQAGSHEVSVTVTVEWALE
ncbi:MAG: SIMPL domain-containing protein [Jiangellales bacterium]